MQWPSPRGAAGTETSRGKAGGSGMRQSRRPPARPHSPEPQTLGPARRAPTVPCSHAGSSFSPQCPPTAPGLRARTQEAPTDPPPDGRGTRRLRGQHGLTAVPPPRAGSSGQELRVTDFGTRGQRPGNSRCSASQRGSRGQTSPDSGGSGGVPGKPTPHRGHTVRAQRHSAANPSG